MHLNTNVITEKLKTKERFGKTGRCIEPVTEPIPERYKDHALTHNWKDYRELHIESDWLLIYQINSSELLLVRMGTHSDLFK